MLYHEFHAGTVYLAEYHRRGEELKAAVSDHLRPRTLSHADNQRLLNELGWHHERGNLVRFFGRSRDPPHEQCGGAVVAAGSHRPGRCRSAPRRAVGRRRSATFLVV